MRNREPKISIRILNNIEPVTAILDIEGAIDSANTELLQSAFDSLDKKRGIKRVVVDMSRVSFFCSSAIGLLLSFSEEKKRINGNNSVALAGVSPEVSNSLSLLGIRDNFAIFPDVKSALSSQCQQQ